MPPYLEISLNIIIIFTTTKCVFNSKEKYSFDSTNNDRHQMEKHSLATNEQTILLETQEAIIKTITTF